MADDAARNLQYEYKAVSSLLIEIISKFINKFPFVPNTVGQIKYFLLFTLCANFSDGSRTQIWSCKLISG